MSSVVIQRQNLVFMEKKRLTSLMKILFRRSTLPWLGRIEFRDGCSLLRSDIRFGAAIKKENLINF